MRLLLRAKVVVCVCVVFGATSAAAAQTPAERPLEALDGLDPVMLVQGKEVEGTSALSVVRGSFTYLFSTADTKAAFEREPAKYELQLGGLCARMGKTTGANPADYFVYKGKIYVFGSDDCHRRFAASPDKYIPAPRAPMATSRDLLTKGQRLLDDAARAIGDLKTLDSMSSYVETFSQIQKRSIGDVSVTTKTIWSFPGRVRQERTLAMAGKTMETSTVLAPDGMWFVSGGGQVYPMQLAGRESLEQDFGRHPIALLRARKSAGFKAAAAGPTRVDGVEVEQVRIVNGGVDVIVHLDAKHRIHSIRFNDRNNEGLVGTYTVLYSDHKVVYGLPLPHTIRAVFDGQPDPIQSWTVDAIAINTPVDAAIFAPKAPAAAK